MSTRRPRRGAALSLLASATAVAALLLAAAVAVPALLGYDRYVVVSGSMEPALPVGSLVYSRPVPVEHLAVGDVITFVPPPEFHVRTPVTHRIVAITASADGTGSRFRTRGDANPDPDPWEFTLDRPVQARMAAHVPYVGYAVMAVRSPRTQLLAVGVPAAVVVALSLLGLWRISGDAIVAERRAPGIATGGAS